VTALASALYEGRVRHRRFEPLRREFSYRLFLMYLDLGELDEVFRGRWLWSARRPAAAWLRRRDHFGDPAVPLEDTVRAEVERRLGRRPRGPIRMLAHLRYFGYCMNPATLFYCFDGHGELDAVVVEVHNTPWGEHHAYVLDARGGRLDARAEKAMHVSPFLDMDYTYRFRMNAPGETLAVHIDNLRDGTPRFDATLTLRRRPIEARTLASVLVRYPLMTLRVTAAIYAQAAGLWLCGVRFHAHPARARKS